MTMDQVPIELRDTLNDAAAAKATHLLSCATCGGWRGQKCDEGLRLTNAHGAAFNAVNRAMQGGLGPYAIPATNRREFA